MTPEEYAARQAAISAAAAVFAYQFAQFFAARAVSLAQWVQLLEFLWPEIQLRRQESAVLARQFYDSQRGFYAPELPRNDVPLEGNDFRVFVQAMEPVRQRMQQPDSPRDAVTKLSLQVMREVENAGRRQIINAVKQDRQIVRPIEQVIRREEPVVEAPSREKLTFPKDVKSELLSILESGASQQRQTWGGATVEEPANLRNSRRELASAGRSDLVRGWARVATGRETCGWCLMLISRGPVYYEANTAGLDLDDESAIEMFRESDLETYGQDTRDFMEDWHTGCDCKVIPVFKTDDWENSRFGQAAKRALDLWNDASAEAEALMDERGSRVHTTGKKKGDPVTFNEEAILALRRRLAGGVINPIEYAGLAA